MQYKVVMFANARLHCIITWWLFLHRVANSWPWASAHIIHVE